MTTLTPLRRVQLPSANTCSCIQGQIRHASLLKRPHRPYTFTQLIALSDGSTYTHRTTSPQPLLISTRDSRNHPMWQPSLASLRNVEQDDAGRLRAFRTKFGRGWDLDADKVSEGGEGAQGGKEGGGGGGVGGAGHEDSLMDLISGGYGKGSAESSNSAAKPVKGKEAAADVKMVTIKNKEGNIVKVPANKK